VYLMREITADSMRSGDWNLRMIQQTNRYL